MKLASVVTRHRRKSQEKHERHLPQNLGVRFCPFCLSLHTYAFKKFIRVAHRASATSGVSTHAPSSFNRSKRVRLTETPEGRGSYRSISRAGSLPTPNDSPPNAKNTGSWSSKGSHAAMSQSSHNYGHQGATSVGHGSYSQQHRAPSRRSLSQASIPISALISPHAPSIGRLSTFHMRDPRKPNPIQPTPWSLSFPSTAQSDESRWSSRGWLERGGSPLHAWLFFIGFLLFPLWWAAALVIPIPRTRTLGESADTEKGVILDDPQLEHGAYYCFALKMNTRRLFCCICRCEIMAHSMSRHGRRVISHLCPVHHSRRHLCIRKDSPLLPLMTYICSEGTTFRQVQEPILSNPIVYPLSG